MENLYVKLAAYREVETERLHLRPVTLEDAPAMFEYASDEAVTRYTFPTNQSLEETRNNIAHLENGGSSSKKMENLLGRLIYWIWIFV